MRLEELIAEWLELGKQDLASAEFLMGMVPIPLEIVGFLCQQSVEKHLKTYLIAHDVEPDKTHDLGYLLSQCKLFDPSFEALAEACAQLSEYAVKTRYPHPGNIDAKAIRSGLSMATQAIAFIDKKLSPPRKD